MKKFVSAMFLCILLCCVCAGAQAAELLDVRPVAAGDGVSIEITADIPMTYTYYKVPGQARAVVDIADADPEKVEPLIVVNKGIVSSISVDKAQIADMVVSRIVFNLVSESDITVTAGQNNKLLTVTFGGSAAPSSPVPTPAPTPITAVPAEPPAAVAVVPEPHVQETVQKAAESVPAGAGQKEEDPLGLDEPVAAVAPVTPPPAAAQIPAVAAAVPLAVAVATKPLKLEPVVPVISRPTTVSIRKIETGDSYVAIKTSAAVGAYTVTKLKKPERIAIDIPSIKNTQKAQTVTINKFGIAKVRVGVSATYIRLVLDSSKTEFPKYTITKGQDGLKINFP